MAAPTFDFAPGLPPPAARWTGRVKFDFTGGNNDPDRLPLDGLIAAAECGAEARGAHARDLRARSADRRATGRCANSSSASSRPTRASPARPTTS